MKIAVFFSLLLSAALFAGNVQAHEQYMLARLPDDFEPLTGLEEARAGEDALTLEEKQRLDSLDDDLKQYTDTLKLELKTAIVEAANAEYGRFERRLVLFSYLGLAGLLIMTAVGAGFLWSTYALVRRVRRRLKGYFGKEIV